MSGGGRAPGLPVTARAVAIGLLASIAIDLVMAYNDYYLQNTLLIGNHFPVASIALLMALVLGVNVAARRWFGVEGLAAGELLLIWGMVGVAGGICSAGIMRYFPSWMVSPAYYATGANEYKKFILDHLPGWLVVSRDPASPAVRWFMEGLPHGGRIPWGAWVAPMTAWFSFILFLYASNFALVSLFYHQWADRERLIFPIIQLPLELAQAAPRGKLLNAFLSNRLTRWGILIPCVIYAINGLRDYAPGIPAIPLTWPVWSIFPDRPWSEFRLDQANLYFSVVGLTFLLTTEIAFSMWAFFVLYKLSFVYVAWLGSGATGYWANWTTQLTVFEAAGAQVAIAGFLCWTARRSLGAWWRRALAGTSDAALDPFPPRLALVLIAGGVTGMAGWGWLAGAQPWAAVLGTVMFVVILLVLTRIVAEAGLMFVQSNVIGYDLLTGLFPHGWLTGATLGVFQMQKAVVMLDLREIFMPYVMNGMKAADAARVRLRPVLWAFVATTVVALAISAYGRITTSYKYGGVNMDEFANVGEPNWLLDQLASYQKNPPAYDFIRAGDTPVLPVSVAHLLTGGLLAGGMLALRGLFVWWPLHPFGLVMCGTWAMSMFWFSILLGWAAKSLIMTFGGASVYRRTLPFFLGLVLGESAMAAFWMVVSLVTGTPGQAILPH